MEIDISKRKTYINPESYLNITDKNLAYILGFIWADGHIDEYTCVVYFVTEDFINIKNIFERVCKFSNHTYQQYNRKERTIVKIHCINFCNFLREHDYEKKSHTSPDNILSKIPDDLKCYFFRGLVDGDGCWSYIKEKRSKVFQISSTYEQDWSYMNDLCSFLNIKGNIRRMIRKNGNKHSDFLITRLEYIKIIGKYLYDSYEEDKIGFDRKHQKYIEIITKFTKQHFTIEFKDRFISLVKEGKTNKEICNILNIKKTSCEDLKCSLKKKGFI